MQEQNSPTKTVTSLLESSQTSLRANLHIVLERRWLVISTFLVVLVLTGIYLAQATPIYEAVARIQINRESENNPLSNARDAYIDARSEADYLQTQYKNLLSRTLIESVARKLELNLDPRYLKSQDMITAIARDITIVPIRLSRLVDVQVDHSDPRKAQLIANTLANTFIDMNLQQRQKAAFEALTWLGTQESDTATKVQKSDDAMQSYREQHNEISLEDNSDIVRQGLFTAKVEMSKAHIEALQAEEQLSEIDNLLSAGTPLDEIPQIRENVVVLRLEQELALKEASLASWLSRYRDKHPLIIQARAEIETLKNGIATESQTVLAALRNNARLLKKREEALMANVEQEKTRQMQLDGLKIEYDALKRSAETSKTIHQNMLVRKSETELASRLQSNNLLLRDPAPLPTSPVRPKVALTIIFGIFAGMAAGIGLAFFVSYLDDSIKSQDDVESSLGLAFLGYVPNIKTNSVIERDLQAHSHPQSNAAEGFRTIRATLSLTHTPEKLHLVGITSTIPSEGKSLVASNFSIVSAQSGLKTLLVDADLRRPSVHKAYQLHSPVGLSAFLMGETSNLDEITHHTEVPNLDVICCGSVPANPSELIGSSRMNEFLELVRNKYDRIILDCPPISAVSDPLVIGAKTDGIVFVTKFNKIRREHARRSVQRLQNGGIHIMGVVINDIDFEGKDSYFYSYYYYQNRYYSSHYKTKKPKDEKKPDSVKT